MPTVSTQSMTAIGTVGAGDKAAVTPTRTNQAGTRARQRNTRTADNVFMSEAYSCCAQHSCTLVNTFVYLPVTTTRRSNARKR
jgi:hypothetical protein